MLAVISEYTKLMLAASNRSVNFHSQRVVCDSLVLESPSVESVVENMIDTSPKQQLELVELRSQSGLRKGGPHLFLAGYDLRFFFGLFLDDFVLLILLLLV